MQVLQFVTLRKGCNSLHVPNQASGLNHDWVICAPNSL